MLMMCVSCMFYFAQSFRSVDSLSRWNNAWWWEAVRGERPASESASSDAALPTVPSATVSPWQRLQAASGPASILLLLIVILITVGDGRGGCAACQSQTGSGVPAPRGCPAHGDPGRAGGCAPGQQHQPGQVRARRPHQHDRRAPRLRHVAASGRSGSHQRVCHAVLTRHGCTRIHGDSSSSGSGPGCGESSTFHEHRQVNSSVWHNCMKQYRRMLWYHKNKL